MWKILVVFLFSVAAAQQIDIPHGHQLTEGVDKQFNMLDTNQDGVLTYDEMESIISVEDADHDGNVTLAEYLTFAQVSVEIGEPIFNAYDKDKDGMIPDSFMQDYFHMIDTNADGEISLHEYEHYVTTFVQCVFGHGQHGHGADCGQ